MRIWILLSGFFLFIPILLPAQTDEGMQTSTDVELQLSSWPEARVVFNQSFIFPFLRGTGPLTKDNNIRITFSTRYTPITLVGSGEVTWTPAAFFLLSGGGQAGSGWNNHLSSGIGLVKPENKRKPDPNSLPGPENPPRNKKIDGSAFDGLVWHTWGAATLQFDLGAVIPGDWNHVLFQTRQEFRYMHYTRAGPDDYWIFKGDDGENRNGWIYMPIYLLGYYMPLSPVLNLIGFMVEMRKPLYNSIGEIDWGETLGKWNLSLVLNFSFTPRFSTIVGIQFWSRRNHGLTDFNNTDIYYQDLPLLDDGGRRRLVFHRVGLIMNFKIH